MNNRRWFLVSAAALCVLLLTLLFPALRAWNSPTPTPTPTVCTTANAVKTVEAFLAKKGFPKNSFAVSPKGFNPPKGSEAWKAGSDAFSSNPVLTLKQLNQLMKAKTGSDALAAAIINERLAGRKAIPVAVMFVGTVHIEGNLGVYGGQAKNLGTRQSAAGDVVWVWVDQSNCQIVSGLVVRAGCGNPGKDVNPPPGPKPSPSPSPTPPGPTPTPCPSGQTPNTNGVCVEPKSGDPKDYAYPSGKPPVPTVTTPPEASPPPVATSKPGGGGVTDNPTKKPGSESGVTAPGASPAPTTPSTPPPNEGGSNDGVVEDGF